MKTGIDHQRNHRLLTKQVGYTYDFVLFFSRMMIDLSQQLTQSFVQLTVASWFQFGSTHYNYLKTSDLIPPTHPRDRETCTNFKVLAAKTTITIEMTHVSLQPG